MALTNLQRVRSMISDETEPYVFSDAVVEDALSFYSENADLRACYLASADLCDRRASVVSAQGDGSEISVGGDLTFKSGSRASVWRASASAFRKSAAEMPSAELVVVAWTDEDRQRSIRDNAVRTHGGTVDPL